MSSECFEVTIEFSGGLADGGRLDGSDHEKATAGVRRLLATHAHTFLHGRVPVNAISNGNGYQIQHVASREGSHIDIWSVVFHPGACVLYGIVGNAYAAEIKDQINGAARFLSDSLRSALNLGSRDLPEFRRVEPYLEVQDGNGAPLIDFEAEHRQERDRLRDRTLRVLYEEVARPIGRSAHLLRIQVEGSPVISVDLKLKREWLEQHINAAVVALRSHKSELGQLPST